ncbi:MAG: DUF4291 domain-containing protein [Polyangiales bacterium]
MQTERYTEQRSRWPSEGRHILASYDDETVCVYQAYRASIAECAVRDQRLGEGGFSFERMSWVKPNFLWMMYRSGWGEKEGQERVLALRVRRAAFDRWLALAVHSSFVAEVYGTSAEWSRAVKRSTVRLQWDPDHDPYGNPVRRRAIQLGLRGAALRAMAERELVSVEDVSAFVAEQRARVRAHEIESLEIPLENVYPVTDDGVRAKLGLSAR